MRLLTNAYRTTVVCFLLISLGGFFGSPAWSQKAADPADVAEAELIPPQQDAEETADAELPPIDAALTLLDQAMDAKLQAKRVSDLEKVIDLCEESIAAGLEAEDEQFARQMQGSCHYEMAKQIVQSLAGGGRVNMATFTRRRSAAVSSLEKAIDANPTDGEAFLLLATIQQLPGGHSELGVESAKKAIELFDRAPRRRSAALLTLASMTEDLDEKIKYFDEAVVNDIENLDAVRARGRAYLLQEKMDEAVRDFMHLVKHDKEDMDSLEIVTQILSAQEKDEEALELMNSVIAENPKQGSAYTMRASLYLVQEKLEEARNDLDTSLDLDPADVSALLARARLSEVEGDFDEAKADVDRALELRPGLPTGFLLRSSICMASGNFRQAISDLRQLLRRDPGNATRLLQIANVYLADDRPTMALDTYDQILKRDPEAWDAVRGRADALLSLGEHKKALEYYEQVLKALPEDSGVLNNLAWVLATSTIDDVRDGKRSVELAEKACELTEYKAAHILSTLAAGHAELGDFEKAREWSEKAVELGEGETKVQLEQELEKYKSDEPWRERQEVEKLEDDLGLGISNDDEEEK